MELAIGCGAVMATVPMETQLDWIIKIAKAAAKWLKDTLNQRGEP